MKKEITTNKDDLDLIGVNFKERLVEFFLHSRSEIETEILKDLYAKIKELIDEMHFSKPINSKGIESWKNKY
jgi:hypothetical protein